MDIRLVLLVLALTAYGIYIVILLGRAIRELRRVQAGRSAPDVAPPPVASRLADLARELAIEQGQSSLCFDVLTADNQLVSVHQERCPHARLHRVQTLVANDLKDGVPLGEIFQRLEDIGVVVSAFPDLPTSDPDPDSVN